MFQETTNFTKFSTAVQLKSATGAWTICQKSSRGIIKNSHWNHVTKRPNAIAEKKQNVQWKGTVKLVYRCDITRPLSKKECPGLAEGEWKSRFYNHKSSFIYKIYSNKTTIPSSIWHLKSASSEIPNLKWSVLRCIPPYPNISKNCLLCLHEKLEMVTYQNQKKLLNKISKPTPKCHHANKFLSNNYTGTDFR